MFSPRRMHPVAAIISFLKQLKDFLFPFLIIIFFGDFSGGIEVVVTGILLLIVLLIGILQWYRFKYWVEDGELRMEFGVFVRKKRYIPFEKMQSLDLTEGILQRPFKLAAVKIETAGSSGDIEANLTAIRKSEAEELRQYMLRSKMKEKVVLEEAEEDTALEEMVIDQPIYKMDFSSLLLLASTSGGALVVIATVFGFLSQFSEIIPVDSVTAQMDNLVGGNYLLIAILFIMMIFVAWLIAVIGSILKYYNFSLAVDGENLVVTKGLLEKKNVTVPLERIQAITISENFLRKLLGYCTVEVVSAGGSIQEAGSSTVVILPFVKATEVANILEEHLVYYDFRLPLKHGPLSSWVYHVLSRLVWWLVVTGIAMYFLGSYWYFGFIILAILLLNSYLKAKNTAYQVQDQLLVISSGAIIKTTKFLRRKRIQSIEKRKSFFHKNRPIASINASIMSGLGGAVGMLFFIEEEDCDAIYQWYSYTEKNQDE